MGYMAVSLQIAPGGKPKPYETALGAGVQRARGLDEIMEVEFP